MAKPSTRISSAVLLSVGLAFVFAYAAISSFMHPLEWVGYVPGFLVHLLAPTTTVRLIASYELVLAVWLLSGRYRKYAALLSALTLAGIVLGNWNQMIITFRDVGLLLMAVALVQES